MISKKSVFSIHFLTASVHSTRAQAPAGAKTGLLAPADGLLFIGIPGMDAPAAPCVYRSQIK